MREVCVSGCVFNVISVHMAGPQQTITYATSINIYLHPVPACTMEAPIYSHLICMCCQIHSYYTTLVNRKIRCKPSLPFYICSSFSFPWKFVVEVRARKEQMGQARWSIPVFQDGALRYSPGSIGQRIGFYYELVIPIPMWIIEIIESLAFSVQLTPRKLVERLKSWSLWQPKATNVTAVQCAKAHTSEKKAFLK